MTERERLIKTLDKTIATKDEDTDDYIEWLADELLENNVKPLPCKINDIVYGISRGEIIPIQIDAIQYTNQGIDIQGHNEEYFSYSIIHLDVDNKIGLEWYYTKEEAEKALEEMRK